MSILHIAFYPSDWLAGTRGMSAEETGVYITLVAHIYEMAGPIERNDERLARMCGCTKAKFRAALAYLVQVGKITEADGFLMNDRAQKEIEKVIGKSDKAKAAAESRWSKKPNENKGSPNANASLGHMPGPCQLEPEPEIDTEDTDVSSDGVAVDARNEAIWKRGVPFLVEKGIEPKQARSVVGKWLKAHGADPLFSALAAAAKSGTQDPIPYITEILKPKPDIGSMVADSIKRIKHAE